MKDAKIIFATILMVVGTVLQCAAQVQIAGSLVVNLDASNLPLGPVGWVTNSVAAGGVFEATGLATVSQPVVVAVGGDAKGIMFDGNNFMQNVASPGGASKTLSAALSGANAPYSIECWVLNPTTVTNDAETMVYWGVRGTTGAQTVFSYSANSDHGLMDHTGNALGWLALPAVGNWHHLVYTFDGTLQKAYVDGVLNQSVPVTGTLNANTSQPITLAKQRNSDGSLFGSGGPAGELTLGKVRIHSAALTAGQVATNYNQEKIYFAMSPAYVAAPPTHRYSFNNAALDDATGQTVTDAGSAGGAGAVIRGNAGTASFTGTKVLLTGGSSGSAPYVDLPNGLLTTLSVSNGGPGKVTLEGWVTVNAPRTWPRLFDIGSTSSGEITNVGSSFSGVNDFMLAQNSTYRDWGRLEIRNNGYNGGPNTTTTRDFGLGNDSSSGNGGMMHYAVTWDEATGEILVYENGCPAMRVTTTVKFNDINDVNCWLGRSAFSGDDNLQGNYDEFRIYNRVLTAAEVQNDYQTGPDMVASDPGTLLALRLPLPHTNLLTGGVDQLVVRGDYLNNSNVVLRANPNFVFASSDPNIVTVSSNGMLQAISPGSATVSVTLAALSASNVVNVIATPGALLAVRLGVVTNMALYSGQQATVRGDFANVTDVDLLSYGTPTFVSANTNVLTASASGFLTSVGPGTNNVTATFGALSSTKPVTVAFPTNRFDFNTFGDGFWNIVNQSNNLVLAGSAGVLASPTNGATDQQFELLYNLQNNTFRIRQRSSWFCIGNISGSSVTKLPAYNGSAGQTWYFEDAGGGNYRIINSRTSQALQSDNATPPNVTLAPVSNSPLQFWRFNYQIHYPKKGTGGWVGQFGSSWGYDWGYGGWDWTGPFLPAPVCYASMQWGGWAVNTAIYNTWMSSAKPVYLMGFNEPDNSSQANLTFAYAIGEWPQLLAMNVPLVSPAPANMYDGWIDNFYQQAANRNYRVDYTATHLYVEPYSDAFMGNLQNMYNTWGHPVWLTEFSPVDWSNTKAWSEQGDYNFLAEFMWMAEDKPWLKRYSIFLFSGTPSTNPWDLDGHRGDFFLADGATLTPYGELYATWDADRTNRVRTPYLIQNLATSFRLTSSNSVSGPRASSIRVRDATTQWALLAAPTANRYCLVSLSDGRRLRDTVGALDLAPVGTTGAGVEWTFTGPDSKGYYFIANPNGSHNLNGSGSAPAITFSAVSSATQTDNTRWRLVKPYAPVALPAAFAPGNLSANPSNHSVAISWAGSGKFFNVYRATMSGGAYTRIASTLTNTAYTDNTVLNGATNYYVVTSLNILGEESGYSPEISATASLAAVWRQQWFGSGNNTGNAADTADPDGDGIINILERAYNLNPTVADTNGWPKGALSGLNFILTYQKNLSATDLTLQVVRSFDLVQWSTNGIADSTVSSDGSTETHAASVPLSDGNAQFLKVRVTSP